MNPAEAPEHACRTVRWPGDEAAARLADPGVLRLLFDADLLVLEQGASGEPPAAAVLDALGRAPCVIVVAVAGGDAGGAPVAVDPVAGAADIVLEPGSQDTALLGGAVEQAIAPLGEAIARAPIAARTLMQVLRTGERQSVADALVLESLAYSMLLGSPEFRRWLATRPAPAAKPEPGAVVLLDRTGDALSVTLNRPHVHNAYNAALRDALVAALGLPDLDPTITAVTVAGAGPSFCSGGDLSEFGSATDVAFAHSVRTTSSAGAALDRVRTRTTVRVHGSCVGAGVELPPFAGTVVADPATTFRLPEVEMGLIPGAGGTVSLPRRIGRQRTALLALWGGAIDAATALRWGLVDRVEPAP